LNRNLVQAHRYRFFTIAAIGTFMGTLDGSILNVALPTIAADLDCRVDVVAWVVMAYAITLVALMMVFGAWAQRRGYPFAYKFGYAAFVAGSLICVLSQSIHLLIIGRVIQAVGAAMFQAVGTGLVAEVFPSEERGKGIGMMVMMVSAGLMAGPPIGGFLLEYFPWQAIFVINLPIGSIALGLSFVFFREFPRPTGRAPIKLAGAAALSVALLSAMLGLSFVDEYPLTDLRVGGCWLVAIVAMTIFFRLETRLERSLIGLEIFRNRDFTLRLLAMFLMFTALSGTLILVPFFLQDVKGLSPKIVGLYLTLLPITMFVAAPLAGRISDRIGYRWLTTGGMILFAVGLAMFHGYNQSATPMFMASALVFLGIGVGIFNTPNSSALMGAVGQQQRATTSGIISTTRNLGLAVGVAISTGLFAFLRGRLSGMAESETFITAFHQVVYVSIALALCSAVISLTRRNRPV
jgi:EmrB/QacA subfamily drug resistance transporter